MLYFHGIRKSELGRIYKKGTSMQYSVEKPESLRFVDLVIDAEEICNI